MNYNQVAAVLDQAALTANPVGQISAQTTFNLEEAYAIQSISLARRYRRGEKFVGLKLGFTSQAKMEQMGVKDMIWGRLTDAMQHGQDDTLSLQNFIHPRAEAEIAFRIAAPITEKISLEQVSQVVDAAAIAIEIIDSRFENFKFSLEDVIADNCSSAAFIIGDWYPIHTPLQNLAMKLSLDEDVVAEGNSNDILGNPLLSIVAAIRLALDNGESLQPGDILLAGAATPAFFLAGKSIVSASVEGLGSISLHIKQP